MTSIVKHPLARLATGQALGLEPQSPHPEVLVSRHQMYHNHYILLISRLRNYQIKQGRSIIDLSLRCRLRKPSALQVVVSCGPVVVQLVCVAISRSSARATHTGAELAMVPDDLRLFLVLDQSEACNPPVPLHAFKRSGPFIRAKALSIATMCSSQA